MNLAKDLSIKEFALNNCHPIDFMLKYGGFSRTGLQGFV